MPGLRRAAGDHTNGLWAYNGPDMPDPNTTVRIFGSLRPFRTERGLPCTLTVAIPPEGMAARDLAVFLHLPPDKIEGVFVNHDLHGIGVHISPGDRVAFVPYGTPGPHRVFLGLYAAGKESDAAEARGDVSDNASGNACDDAQHEASDGANRGGGTQHGETG